MLFRHRRFRRRRRRRRRHRTSGTTFEHRRRFLCSLDPSRPRAGTPTALHTLPHTHVNARTHARTHTTSGIQQEEEGSSARECLDDPEVPETFRVYRRSSFEFSGSGVAKNPSWIVRILRWKIGS